jgi:hypothetical protein
MGPSAVAWIRPRRMRLTSDATDGGLYPTPAVSCPVCGSSRRDRSHELGCAAPQWMPFTRLDGIG